MVTDAAAGFGRPGVVRQGWYVLLPQRRLRCGDVRSVNVGTRRLVVYRDLRGRAHVVDERCPHLGSDLALARVTADGLRCGFHGWCWGAGGACIAAPGNEPAPPRRLRAYAAAERWGFLWAWLGSPPAFALPEVPAHLRRRVALPSQRVNAHPDVIFSNGFDLAHFGPSHGIDAGTRALAVEPWKIAHHVAGRLSRRTSLRAVGLGGRELDFSFAQHGGGIVQVHIRQPLEFLIFFTLRPESAVASRTRTLLFLRRRRDLVRALAVLWSTALDDLRQMESIAWTGAFAPSDAALQQYARFVQELPAW